MDKKKIFKEIRPAGESNEAWYREACSSSGQYILASTYGGFLYLSTDYGETWNIVNYGQTSGQYWFGLAISQTGQYMWACAIDGGIWKSSDYGSNWVQVKPFGIDEYSCSGVSISNNGQYIYICNSSGHIYISADYGVNWNDKDYSSVDWAWWSNIACSKDGKYIIANSYGSLAGGVVYLSTDYGITWAEIKPRGDEQTNWDKCCLNYTGERMLINAGQRGIYLSTDYGVTWNILVPKNFIMGVFTECAMDDSGLNIYVADYYGKCYWSQNGGNNWKELKVFLHDSNNWSCMATNSDGNYIFIGVYLGRMYKGQNDPYLWPQTYNKIYETIGLKAHGRLGKLWIHQTYKYGKRVIKYNYPPNPRTYFQQSNRALLAQAVGYWQTFDETTKNFYNEWAKKRPLLGYNRYISLYLKANKNMIIYWNTLEKDANDTSTIPQYMASEYAPIVQRSQFNQNDYHCCVYQASDQNLYAGSTQKINLGGITLDPLNLYSGNQINIPITGLYLLNCRMWLNSGSVVADTRYILFIYKNGEEFLDISNHSGNNSLSLSVAGSKIAKLQAGDYIDLRAQHSSASNDVDIRYSDKLTALEVSLIKN